MMKVDSCNCGYCGGVNGYHFPECPILASRQKFEEPLILSRVIVEDKQALEKARLAGYLAALHEVRKRINDDRAQLSANGLLSPADKGYTRAIMIIEETYEEAAK